MANSDSSHPTGSNPSLLSTGEVALLLGVSQPTLSRWRFEGSGPRYLKLGSTPKAVVRYRRTDVLAYLAACERRSTARLGDPTRIGYEGS